MKYIKKKANQEQNSSNFSNLHVNSQNNDQMLASEMEHNSAGLPPTDKIHELNTNKVYFNN